MEYKVLTQKDKLFSGKFDPQRLESVLNQMASQGWRVVSMAVMNVPGFGAREEMVVLLEKPLASQV